MLQMNERMRLPDEDRPLGPPEVRALPTPPEPPKRWPWIAGGVVVIVAVVAAAFWWLFDSTVSESTYDEVVAELTASNEAVDTLGTENEELSTALSVETDRVAEANELADSLSSQLDDVMETATHNAYLSLNWLPADLAAMQEAGLDTTTGDALLATLGEIRTWDEWVDSDRAWLRVQGSLSEIDDEALTEAWGRYQQAEIGSIEELAAIAEFNTRLAYLILDPITDG